MATTCYGQKHAGETRWSMPFWKVTSPLIGPLFQRCLLRILQLLSKVTCCLPPPFFKGFCGSASSDFLMGWGCFCLISPSFQGLPSRWFHWPSSSESHASLFQACQFQSSTSSSSAGWSFLVFPILFSLLARLVVPCPNFLPALFLSSPFARSILNCFHIQLGPSLVSLMPVYRASPFSKGWLSQPLSSYSLASQGQFHLHCSCSSTSSSWCGFHSSLFQAFQFQSSTSSSSAGWSFLVFPILFSLLARLVVPCPNFLAALFLSSPFARSILNCFHIQLGPSLVSLMPVYRASPFSKGWLSQPLSSYSLASQGQFHLHCSCSSTSSSWCGFHSSLFQAFQFQSSTSSILFSLLAWLVVPRPSFLPALFLSSPFARSSLICFHIQLGLSLVSLMPLCQWHPVPQVGRALVAQVCLKN